MRIALWMAALLALMSLACAQAGTGHLGLALTDAPSGAPPNAAMVAQIVPGSAASRSGLRVYDVIVSIDGRSVEGATRLKDYILARNAGDKLTFDVLRPTPQGGQRLRLTAILGAEPTVTSAPAASSQSGQGQFNPPTVQAGQPAPVPSTADEERLVQSVRWTLYTDPLEHAFTLLAPAGWRTEGGLIRTSPVTINPVMHMTAPDHSVVFVFGDPDLAWFAVPNQVSQMSGGREGMRYVTAGGQINELRHYIPGQQFAELEGKKLLAPLCANISVQSSRARPDVIPPRSVSGGVPVHPQAGDAEIHLRSRRPPACRLHAGGN